MWPCIELHEAIAMVCGHNENIGEELAENVSEQVQCLLNNFHEWWTM
jgi:hypothetical protein